MKKILILVSAGMLCSCAIVQQERMQQAKAQLNEDYANCGRLRHAGQLKTRSDLADCLNSAISRDLMPAYPYPDLLMDLEAKQSEVAIKLDKKQITKAEADVLLKQEMAAIATDEQARNNQAQLAAAQRSQAMAALSAAFLNRPTPPAPTTTQCHMFMGTMTCT